MALPFLSWLWPQPVALGPRGERFAARWLKRRGYKIVARGARSRFGELDLVAVQGETIVFVEVKTRRSATRGTPAEAVNRDKQKQIARAALMYLKEHHLLEYASRFDVIALTWPEGDRRPRVEHFQNAFEPEGKGQFFS